jgi:tryptophan-rich sensory protein
VGLSILVGAVAVVTVVLVLSARDVWYENLRHPVWAAPVAALLVMDAAAHVAIALAGWRIWVRASGSAAVSLWVVLLGLSLGWTATFFGLWQPRLSLAVAVILLALAVTTAAAAWPETRIGGGLLVLFVVWAAYLVALSSAVATLN